MQKLKLKDLEVLWDNVLIRPVVTDEQEDGVIKPNQYEDKAEMGIIVKIGEGRLLDNGEWILPRVKEGDLVVFNRYGPTKLKIEAEDYLYIREEDIISRQENQ